MAQGFTDKGFTASGGGSGGDPLTTKGDIMAYDTDADRVPIGTDDQVLTVDSTTGFGLKWADSAGGGTTSSAVVARMYATADQTLTGTVEAEVGFDTTLFASPASAVSLSDNAFVAPVDGTYEIQCCFHYDTTSVDFRVEIAIDDVTPTNASFLAKRDISANRAIVGNIMVEMSAGEKATFLVKTNTGGDLRGASVGVETWASFKLIDNTGDTTVMFDLLHSKKVSADTPDDEFDSTTLDGKWTAVTGSLGTVDLAETGEVEKYDLTTRPGWMLLQAGSAADQKVELRQDFTIADGTSIVMACTWGFAATDGDPGIAANEAYFGIAINDNDTGYDAGSQVRLYASAIANGNRLLVFDGSALASTQGAGLASPTILPGAVYFLRIMRSGTTYRFYWSDNGGAWQPFGSKVISTPPDNLWIFSESVVQAGDPVPIHAVAWIRQGTNGLDPWNPTAAVAVSAGGWEDWIDVDAGVGFQNSWVNNSGGEQAAEYRKHSDGSVQIRGIIADGTINQVAFVLPTGYRPEFQSHWGTVSNALFGQVDVYANGDVRPKVGSSTWFALWVIEFDSTGGS